MHDMFWIGTTVALLPTMTIGTVWAIGNHFVGRPAPVRVRRRPYAGIGPGDVIIIRKP